MLCSDCTDAGGAVLPLSNRLQAENGPPNAGCLLLLVQVALMLTMWTSGTSSSCQQPGRWGSPPAAGSKGSSTCLHLPASLIL